MNLEVAILDLFCWEQGPLNSVGCTSKHDRTVNLIPPVSIPVCAFILDKFGWLFIFIVPKPPSDMKFKMLD